MRHVTLLLSCLLCVLCLGCGGYFKAYIPTSPGYEYDPYDHGSYDSGDYDSHDQNEEDDDPILSRNIEGEWEGFLYEDSRSDNLELSKKLVAMRSTWTGTNWSDGVRYEWVRIDLLIDGRPTAYLETEVGEEGYIYFTSQKDDIEIEMEGWFEDDMGDGWMDLSWDEKVTLPDSDKVEMHYVELGGDFELDRVRGSQWAAAWKLFDTYGAGASELGDNVWETATRDGMSHLAQLEQTALRRK